MYSAEYTVLYTIHVDALETERTEKIMPPRNRILLEQRQRIIQAFEDVSEDYLTVAATIGVNRSTARSIVARYLREGRSRRDHEEEQIMSESVSWWHDFLGSFCLRCVYMNSVQYCILGTVQMFVILYLFQRKIVPKILT